jgi:hypothetical protein
MLNTFHLKDSIKEVVSRLMISGRSPHEDRLKTSPTYLQGKLTYEAHDYE